MREEVPLHQMRGAFPPIDQNNAMSILIQGPYEEALTAFAKAFKAHTVISSVYGRAIPIRKYPYFLFRFKGSQWSNVVLGGYYELHGKIATLARAISDSLSCKVFLFTFEGTACVLEYRLYDGGQISELMSFDASERFPRILTQRQVRDIMKGGVKSGFYFYSSLRKITRSQLNERNFIEFVSDAFRRNDALLYLAVEWDMKTSEFRLIHGNESDLERVDMVITDLRGIRGDD